MNKCTSFIQQSIRGYIDLINYGGFLARFWGSYEYNGLTYQYSSGILTIGTEQRISIPQCSTNINVNIDIAVLPRVWIPVFYSTYDTNDERCYVTYGITLMPFCDKIPCTSPGMISQFLSNVTFLPFSNFCNENSNPKLYK
ncbi:hypothetical protein [Clostridium botulinum]|uniref:Uncharacterized protein n=1 Tax=Clostridium botulinum TaxID=1491 RepID=A0A9Q1V0H7_CLOBO|nr:hypothetical protein [Clostridium botulinum]AEB75151.1 hypothetical protein CbC4_0471 [Clostridium botulinum BKT015925]KEI00508.1 hypothetical protein Y848_11355 [Clostridium botulinum C/D str. Sp77]KEI01895.1 hypothetical protein Z953_08460 [Clostridium botulinum D str. 16868]KLU74862.1 hypothetical protein CBC3_11810 [Clostridium botulinum V891]KOA77179.1 hypothetical protein ADU78_04230 [Clostridium botulinum]